MMTLAKTSPLPLLFFLVYYKEPSTTVLLPRILLIRPITSSSRFIFWNCSALMLKKSYYIIYIGVDGPIPVTKIPFTTLACSSSSLVAKDSWCILYCLWLFLYTFFQCLLEFFLGTRFSYYPIKYTEMKSTTAFSFSFFKYILTDCISH